MKTAKIKNKLLERLYWLIRLRWIAVTGVAAAVYLTSNVFKMSIPAFPLYSVGVFLGLYNLAFFVYLNLIRKKSLPDIVSMVNKIANAQISIDLLALTFLLHYSGGIENPFIFYFIFHMIIASILLTRRAAFFQATFAVFIFSSMVFLEFYKTLPHYSLEGFAPPALYSNLSYILGLTFAFASTLYIAVYMASSISIKLKQREESLREANKLLREKDRVKSEYVRRVTHDIKEHLAAIQCCVEPVADGITGPLNNGQKDLLSRAADRVGKLLFYAKNLLEITRIKLTKKLEVKEFSLADLAKSIYQDMRARAANKGVSLELDVDPSIDKMKGVRVYVEEAIQNLLANSIKYTPRGGMINLEIRDDEALVSIYIKDTGIGIPKDDLSHVFEEFYRGKNARQVERMGTGLGLSIAKEIMDMHKGKIIADSEEGKGTVIKLEFPKSI